MLWEFGFYILVFAAAALVVAALSWIMGHDILRGLKPEAFEKNWWGRADNTRFNLTIFSDFLDIIFKK